MMLPEAREYPGCQHPQKLGRAWAASLRPCQHLDAGPVTSRTREVILLFKRPACGAWLQRPWDTRVMRPGPLLVSYIVSHPRLCLWK